MVLPAGARYRTPPSDTTSGVKSAGLSVTTLVCTTSYACAADADNATNPAIRQPAEAAATTRRRQADPCVVIGHLPRPSTDALPECPLPGTGAGGLSHR